MVYHFYQHYQNIQYYQGDLNHKEYDRTKKVIDICTHYCDFYDVKFYSIVDHPDVIQVDSLNYHDYIYIKGKGLTDYFDTEFSLSIEWDGFVVNPDAWTDDFLKYDYIGATNREIWNRDKVGGVHPYTFMNGGFCLRSKRLQDIVKNDNYRIIKLLIKIH